MHYSKVTIVFLLLILPSIASMQTVGSTSEQLDEGLYFGGQKGSILEGAIFSGSGNHECAIVDQNSIECWGSNQYGQFGNGQSYQNPSYSHSMVNLPSNVSSVHEISSGYNFNCAIVNYGSVICWGSYDPSGSTGDWDHYTPVYVDLPSDRIAVSIDSLSGGVTVILDDGTIYCLETLFPCDRGLSQVNTGSSDFTPFTEVIAFGGNDGGLECVALADNYSIFCIGGTLGVGGASYYTPHWINITRPNPWSFYTGLANQSHSSFSMSVGGNHLCWILMASYIQQPRSFLECYGVHENTDYSGNGVHSARSGVTSTFDVISVSSGTDHTCFLKSNGSVYCAGDNRHGQLGPNAPVYYSSSVHVPLTDGKLATAIYSNEDSSCAASTDGALYCWGERDEHNEPPPQSGGSSPIVTIALSSSLQLLNRDADNDGVLNVLDLCSEGESNWESSNSTDYDYDGCRDSSEDFDDDNDLVLDNDDSCPTSSWVINWNDLDTYGVSFSHPAVSGSPHYNADTDGDGCHNTEDSDDDNDGVLDEDDIFRFDSEEWADNDGDGNSSNYPGYAYKWWVGQTQGGDNWDMDDDNDGWSDAWESACLTDSLNSDSVPLDTDDDSGHLQFFSDGPGYYGIWNMNETTVGEILNGTFIPNSNMFGCDLIDIDDDGDLVNDTEDAFPLNPYEWLDTDGDAIGNNADYDDDGDGYNDTSDAFPLNVSEWSDTDGDGIGNNADTDDDDDGYTDNLEIGCGTDSLDANNTPPDFDED